LALNQPVQSAVWTFCLDATFLNPIRTKQFGFLLFPSRSQARLLLSGGKHLSQNPWRKTTMRKSVLDVNWVTEQSRPLLAHHVSGCAVGALSLSRLVEAISIGPKGHLNGNCALRPLRWRPRTFWEWQREAVVCLAGLVCRAKLMCDAEAWDPKGSVVACRCYLALQGEGRGDFQAALDSIDCAAALVDPSRAEDTVDYLEELSIMRAIEVMTEDRWPVVCSLAEALLQKRTITSDELQPLYRRICRKCNVRLTVHPAWCWTPKDLAQSKSK